MKKIYKKKKASTTIEAVIIMPTILIIIMAVFFAFQILYEHVVLEYGVSYGATRGAMLWDYNVDGVDLEKGTVGEKVGPYNNLNQMLTGAGISERENMVKNLTQNALSSLSMFGENADVQVDYKGSILGRTIKVTATEKINIPFEALLAYFNNGDFQLTASSKAVLYDPDEYIRNVDYVYEISSSILGQVKEKISAVLDKIKK